jgi:small subunit ribosomal protein S9
MADDRTPADEETPQEPTAGEEQEPATEQPAAEPVAEEAAPAQEPAPAEPVAEAPAAAEQPAAAEAPAAAEQPAAAEAPAAAEQPAAAEAPAAAEQPAAAEAPAAAEQPAAAEAPAAAETDDDDEEEPAPRQKPEIPGADLEVDLVMEGSERGDSPYDEDDDGEPSGDDADDVADDQPIAAVTIDLAAGARYSATGKRKTAVARVILRPGTGAYTINGRTLDEFFPRTPLQRNIRQPLEAVGYETRMDVVARMHGGGVSAQAGALRHGISRALLEADPNLRGELKRRGFLTRDPRVKERKKAGLKKARKRPQFSKR